MRLGPRSIVCCHGLAGFICLADWANHAVLRRAYHRHLCDRHERVIRSDFIVTTYWRA